MIRLRHVASVNPASPEFDRLGDDVMLPFVPLEAVWPGGLDASRRKAKGDASTGYTRFVEGDIVLPKITPTFQADRTTIAVGLEGGVAAGTTELHVVRPGSGVDRRYVRYLLSSRPFLHGGEAEMIGVAGQKRVPDAWLRDFPVPVTDLAEQRAIADYLDAETARIDALIAKKRRLLHLLDEHWAVEVVQRTTAVAESGERMALRRVIESTVGGAWGNEPGSGEVDVLCVRGADFDTLNLGVNTASAPLRGLTHAEYRSRGLLPGDLIIEKSGGGEKSPVGRVVQWSSPDPAVPTNFAARVRPAPSVDSRFLAYVFRAAYEIGLTRAWIKQTTGIQNLDLGGLLSEKWTFPALGEQLAIVRYLESASEYRIRASALLTRQIDLLVERRQALITAAVSGELSVTGVAS